MAPLRSLAAYTRLPDPRPLGEIDDEIREELEFHLEMRTLEGIRAGLPPEQARHEAHERFGDVARIHQTCRRILVGDRIMLQRFQAVLTVLLLVAVVFLGVRFYLWQQASDATMAKMSQSLEQIAARSDTSPSLSEDDLKAIHAASPPVVVETFPANGASDVDPSTPEIRATFSKLMRNHSWSWCYDPASGPETAGEVHYLDDGKTCVMPVKLKSGTTYDILINSETYQSFADREGNAAVPYHLQFTTRK
jgi:hypothetical protein